MLALYWAALGFPGGSVRNSLACLQIALSMSMASHHDSFITDFRFFLFSLQTLHFIWIVQEETGATTFFLQFEQVSSDAEFR